MVPRSGRAAFASAMRALLSLALLLASQLAWGHATQLSASRIELSGRTVQVQLEVNARDLEAALHTVLTGADGQVDAAALAHAQAAIADYVLARARVIAPAGNPCSGGAEAIRPRAEHVLLTVRWTCPPASGVLGYHVTLFQEIDPAARHMVTVQGDARRMGLLGVASPRLDLAQVQAGRIEVAWHYFLSGLEHIAIGHDHIAFLVAVILWGRRLWPLVAVVTAFTVAHSITLTAAVLDVVSLPSRLVEVLIALSIVYVAAENFFVHDLKRRWRVTFCFGLVHGFGFASVLRDFGIPREALASALFAFNLGVEAGQVAVVLAAAGLTRVLEMVSSGLPGGAIEWPDRRLVYPVSAAILALGLFWTAQRLLE